ncbi:MAG TPA: formate dehydrogenase accessory protein FdhE [Spirochaetota bacterium]|nr:formate dehydrogenase accessory protein FdhE [Spirochaetota bacterium]
MHNHKTTLELYRKNLLKQEILTEENINFYADIFDYQFNKTSEWTANLPAVEIQADGTEPVLKSSSIKCELIPPELLFSSLSELAAIIHKHNPGMDFSHAIDSIKKDPGTCNDIIESLTAKDTSKFESLAVSSKLGLDEYLFLAVNWFKPLFIALREKHHKADPDTHKDRTCPFCGYYPDMAIFAGEKEGKRYLRCGLCENQWPYRRISCAICGESNQKKLEYFSEEGHERYRIDACHTCNGYVKSVKLNKFEEPESCDLSIENLLTLSFDAEMLRKGFSKP